jgi:hypothetical protein
MSHMFSLCTEKSKVTSQQIRRENGKCVKGDNYHPEPVAPKLWLANPSGSHEMPRGFRQKINV